MGAVMRTASDYLPPLDAARRAHARRLYAEMVAAGFSAGDAGRGAERFARAGLFLRAFPEQQQPRTPPAVRDVSGDAPEQLFIPFDMPRRR